MAPPRGVKHVFVSADDATERNQEQSALMPMIHVAASDLPSTTRASELGNRNAVTLLRADADLSTGLGSAGEGISLEGIGKCLRFLFVIKFMPCPMGRGRELPHILVDTV
jgi:L-2-aminoadipate reductase